MPTKGILCFQASYTQDLGTIYVGTCDYLYNVIGLNIVRCFSTKCGYAHLRYKGNRSEARWSARCSQKEHLPPRAWDIRKTGALVADLQREGIESGWREDTGAGLKREETGNAARGYHTLGLVPGPWLLEKGWDEQANSKWLSPQASGIWQETPGSPWTLELAGRAS